MIETWPVVSLCKLINREVLGVHDELLFHCKRRIQSDRLSRCCLPPFELCNLDDLIASGFHILRLENSDLFQFVSCIFHELAPCVFIHDRREPLNGGGLVFVGVLIVLAHRDDLG